MAVSKKAIKNNNYKLKSSLKKNGLDHWRYFFNGVNTVTGDERIFFIELISENPALSPEKLSLPGAASDSKKIDSENLQDALAGNIEIESGATSSALPSFACVRAGVFGKHPKQMCRYLSNAEFSAAKKSFSIKAGGCAFADNELYGVLNVSEQDVQSFQECAGDSGRMEWNLKYERTFDDSETSTKDGFHWFASGITALFSGFVNYDGVEYAVSPDHSFGFTDKSWGTGFPVPFFHVSSGRLTSIFTGSVMKESGFALEADYDGKAVALAKFGPEFFSFGKKKRISKYESRWSCVRAPVNQGEDELHWSVSINCKKYILDIDIFCPISEMLVKDYYLPDGQVVKVLCGGSGSGEIRLYKLVRKSLELIQHCKVLDAVCEFGQKD